MSKECIYKSNINCTGNTGEGTSNYAAYSWAHEISADGKDIILGSADPIFCGDRSRYNPAESVVAAISGCHMLCYLHFLLLSRISARLRQQIHPCV